MTTECSANEGEYMSPSASARSLGCILVEATSHGSYKPEDGKGCNISREAD